MCLRSATIAGYSNYIIYEDGRVYNIQWKRFLKITDFVVVSAKGERYVYHTIRMRDDDGKSKLFYVDTLMRKYFGAKLPEIEGVEHKPIKGYEGLYDIYSNGGVYSHTRERFMSSVNIYGDMYVLLVKGDQKKQHRVARLVLQAFGTNYSQKDRVVFKDGNKYNCDINNLTSMKKGNKNENQ